MSVQLILLFLNSFLMSKVKNCNRKETHHNPWEERTVRTGLRRGRFNAGIGSVRLHFHFSLTRGIWANPSASIIFCNHIATADFTIPVISAITILRHALTAGCQSIADARCACVGECWIHRVCLPNTCPIRPAWTEDWARIIITSIVTIVEEHKFCAVKVWFKCWWELSRLGVITNIKPVDSLVVKFWAGNCKSNTSEADTANESQGCNFEQRGNHKWKLNNYKMRRAAEIL